jgi:hypothetical protein
VLRAVTFMRLVAALVIAAAGSALWASPAGAKGFPFGRDIRITCDAGHRAEIADRGSPLPALPRERLRRTMMVVGCATLPNQAGTVQLTAAPRAPFRGCVLDSYTVVRRSGGILCADFSQAFTRHRKALGLWITRLTRDGPSVALGAATSNVGQAFLWYWLRSDLSGVTPLTTIPVPPSLAHRLGATEGFSYLAGGLPPETDLCQGTVITGRAGDRPFGPSAFLDTSLITRTEGDGGLTETPLSRKCTGRRWTSSDPVTVARTLTSAFSTLFPSPAG